MRDNDMLRRLMCAIGATTLALLSSCASDQFAPPTTDGGCSLEAGATCGLAPQCGCATREACAIDITARDGTTKCVAEGTRGEGMPCALDANDPSASQCAAGLICVAGSCHKYCDDPGEGYPCKTNGTFCSQARIAGSLVPNAFYCSIACTLTDPLSCGGEGRGCLYLTAGRVDCATVGVSTTTCASSTDCAPGYQCAALDGKPQCLKHCLVGGAGCGTKASCTPTSPPHVVGGLEYGACVPL